MISSLDGVIEGLPRAYPGPGGAVAVLREGEVVARHAWGWANAERRIAFTPKTLFRICSITKQFVCALLLDAFPDPTVLDGDVRARLPTLEGPAPGALHLAHNQSGLRDYWALAMLHGSPAEAPFGDAEAAAVISAARTLQFPPGAHYSYANQNFKLLAWILQARAGRGLAELLRTRIFDPAGMESAFVAADTRAMPDGSEGYEGSQETGFRAATNRILWDGDAGMGASLDDMIAWERFIDATRDDAAGLYRRLTAPVTFADGASASYGFGLGRRPVLGRSASGHGGGLRGWRSHRLYVPAERVSVVVMFNHMAEAHDAAMDLLAAVLGEERPPRPTDHPTPGWLGAYVEPRTGLAVRLDAAPEARVRLRYANSAELLDVQADGTAGTEGTRLRLGEGGLWMDRPGENQSSLLSDLTGPPTTGRPGLYRCEELDAELTIADAGGGLYGALSGFLGRGRMELLDPVGPNLWTLPCHRALDHNPPGDWTLAFRPGGVDVGCW
ncbi:MAG TPA: D-aminopeptidase, partial [Caulobacteraceae bacterium]